jgi:hypothetical protein
MTALTRTEKKPHDGQDETSHQTFDPEPARSLGPDEVPTPAWLPALGGALLFAAAVWLVAARQAGPAGPLPASGPATTATAVPAFTVTAVPTAPSPRAEPPRRAPAPGRPDLTPEKLREMQRQFEEYKRQNEGKPKVEPAPGN